MQISFDTATIHPHELNALAALVASLGGRLPAANQTFNISGVALPEVLERVEATRGSTAPVVYADELAIPTDEDVPPPPSTEGNAGPTPTPDADITEATSAGISTETASAGIELDADGIPWDERIHASTKTKTKADVWTKKRNVDEVLYGQVHAELQEQYAGKDEEVPPPPPSNTTAENAPTADTDVPPPPAPAALEGFEDFASLVAAVAPFGLPYVKLADLAHRVTDGLVGKFPDLRDKPDYWTEFYEAVKAEV